jgi:hypothetical protein
MKTTAKTIVPPVVEAAALVVHDSLGNIRTDYSDAEISSLDETSKSLLVDLIASRLEEQKCDEELRKNYVAVSKLSDDLASKHEAVLLIRPHTADDRRVDQVRKVIRANNPHAEPVEESKEERELVARIEKAEQAAAAAVDDVLNARQKVIFAKDGQRRARNAIAAAVAAWVAGRPIVTRESLVREAAARSQERLLAIKNGTFVSPPAAVPPSRLDAAMTSRSRGKSTRRAC